jgi:hypothetical protein
VYIVPACGDRGCKRAGTWKAWRVSCLLASVQHLFCQMWEIVQMMMS